MRDLEKLRQATGNIHRRVNREANFIKAPAATSATQTYSIRASKNHTEQSFCGEEMVGLDVNPQAYSEAHFATFPEWLVTPLIKAGTSEKGACPECGAPWIRIVEKGKFNQTGGSQNTNKVDDKFDKGAAMSDSGLLPGFYDSKTIGWQPTCSHKAEPVPCVVLDPFGGSGTTKNVADRLGRRGVMCELKMEYIEMAKKRCYALPGLFV